VDTSVINTREMKGRTARKMDVYLQLHFSNSMASNSCRCLTMLVKACITQQTRIRYSGVCRLGPVISWAT